MPVVELSGSIHFQGFGLSDRGYEVGESPFLDVSLHAYTNKSNYVRRPISIIETLERIEL